MKRAMIPLFVILGVACCAGPAQGAIITIAIEGVVDDVVEAGDYLNGRIKVGDLITGTFTYDTDTSDSSPLSYGGRYEHFSYPYGVSLSVGGLDFITDPAKTNFLVEIVNNYYGDAYHLRSYNNLPLGDTTSVGNIEWILEDPSGTAISSADLPRGAPVLDDWATNFLQFGAGSGGGRGSGGGPAIGFGVMGHVSSAVVIPEPATVLLLGLGGIALVHKVRK